MLNSQQIKAIVLLLCCSMALLVNAQVQVSGLSHFQLKFIENKGQWNDEIRFRAELPNGFFYIRQAGLSYHFFDAEKVKRIQERRHNHHHNHARQKSHDSHPHEPGNKEIIDTINNHLVQVNFIGANSHAEIRGRNEYGERLNYFYGNDERKWARGIMPCAEVIIQDVYPNIDFIIRKEKYHFKYEFVVHPGGKPSKIKMEYEGADQLFLNKGKLNVITSLNTIVENPPYAYQKIYDQEINVPCDFKLNEKVLSFSKGSYDKRYDLILDPQLIFSGYSGSVADNWGNTACFDAGGNLYSGSTVFNVISSYYGIISYDGFPTSPGAFRSFHQGGDTDIGILKFSPDGKRLIYGTYIGGNDSEIPISIITNDQAELYILAVTGSRNFPITDLAFDRTFNGGQYISESNFVGGYSFNNGTDIALIKLSSGGGLLASTYVGGSENDGVNISSITRSNYGDQLRGEVNLDEQGNVYVASTTFSNDFPIENAFQPIPRSTYFSNACVFKMNDNLTQMYWSSYLGGQSADVGMSVTVNKQGEAYVTGGTYSRDFPINRSSLPGMSTGNVDAFVTHISSDGRSYLSSTKLGTSSFDQGYFVQLDDEENVYVLGQTRGLYNKSSGVYHKGNSSLFIHKLNKTLDQTFFSTTIGDGTRTNKLSPTAFLVNDCQNILLSGWGGGRNTNSIKNYPTTTNAYQRSSDGSDFYLMLLRKNADSLLYATFFGGDGAREHVDGGTSRFDKKGIVYQSVCASCGAFGRYYPSSEGFPIYPSDVYSNVNRSMNCNNGVFKFNLAYLKARFEVSDTCSNFDVQFKNTSSSGQTFYWDFGDGMTYSTSSRQEIQHTYSDFGIYNARLIAVDPTTCVVRDTFELTIRINGGIENNKFEYTLCANDSIFLTAGLNDPSGLKSYQWYPTATLKSPGSKSTWAFPESNVMYLGSSTDIWACTQVDTFQIKLSRLDLNTDSFVKGNCDGNPTIVINNKTIVGAPTRFEWFFGGQYITGQHPPPFPFIWQDSVTIFAKAENNYCQDLDTFKVFARPVEIANVVTPNDDGSNDQFMIKNIEGSGDWDVQVYDRWGIRVYYDKSYGNDWSPAELSPATYYYLITSPDGNQCKGWVLIYR